MRSVPVTKTPALPCSRARQLVARPQLVGLVGLDLEMLAQPRDDVGEHGAGDEDLAGFMAIESSRRRSARCGRSGLAVRAMRLRRVDVPAEHASRHEKPTT